MKHFYQRTHIPIQKKNHFIIKNFWSVPPIHFPANEPTESTFIKKTLSSIYMCAYNKPAYLTRSFVTHYQRAERFSFEIMRATHENTHKTISLLSKRGCCRQRMAAHRSFSLLNYKLKWHPCFWFTWGVSFRVSVYISPTLYFPYFAADLCIRRVLEVSNVAAMVERHSDIFPSNQINMQNIDTKKNTDLKKNGMFASCVLLLIKNLSN